MELRQYFSVLWKWSWMIVLAVGLAAGLSYVVTSRQPKLYQASTKLLIGQSIQSVNPSSQDMATSQALAYTYIQIAKTTVVLQGTIDALGLNMSTGALAERFNARLIAGTQLIELRVDDVDPARARALADELAHQLTLQGPAAQEGTRQRDFVEKQVEALRRKIEEGQKAITELDSSIQVTLSAREIATKRQQITAIENQINQWQQSYAAMLGFLAPRSPNYLQILEPAQLPTRPYAPNVMLNVILAAAVGLVLSLSATIAIEYLDDTLKHPDDITRVLQLPTLSTLARIGKDTQREANSNVAVQAEDDPAHTTNPESLPGTAGNGHGNGRSVIDAKLITALLPRSSEVEAYRVLRTNVQFMGIDKPIKTILITSSNSGEGKSFVAANLSVVMAQAGYRTVLLDCDLRKPTQHRLFGFANNVGLTNSLMAHGDLDGFVHQTPIENLRVFTTGPLPPNPAELLGSQRMHALKTRLEAEADVLVFDSPPLLPVTDAALLAHQVDGVILVVDVTHTGRKDALRAKEILVRAGARILGVALNRVSPKGSDYYYYHHYSHAAKGSKHKQRNPKSPRFPILVQWFHTLTNR